MVNKTAKKKEKAIKKSVLLKRKRSKLDKLFNTYIKERDGECILTGDTESLQCSHYYDKKENPYLRWDERNAHAMANHKGNAVHFRHHHGKAPDYSLWMFEHHTIAFMKKLSIDANKKKVYTIEDIERLIRKYEVKLNKLRGL
jgi:hypothetical protein